MAGGGGINLNLALRRSSQSGDKLMVVGAAWQTVFTDSSSLTYLFGGANLDMTQMQAGDTIDVQVLKRVKDNGPLVVHDARQMSGAQPTNHKLIRIGPAPDVYGIVIQMRQTAGVGRTIPCEFTVAKL
jgi:hypothetical protein